VRRAVVRARGTLNPRNAPGAPCVSSAAATA